MFNFSYYTGTFLVGAHRFGVPLPKLQTFSEIFWALPTDHSLYKKMILGKVKQQKEIFGFTNSETLKQFYKQTSFKTQ